MKNTQVLQKAQLWCRTRSVKGMQKVLQARVQGGGHQFVWKRSCWVQVEQSQLEPFQDSLQGQQGWLLKSVFAAHQLTHHPAGAKMPGRGEWDYYPAFSRGIGSCCAQCLLCVSVGHLHGGQYLLIKGFHFLPFQRDPYLPLAMHTHKIPALIWLKFHL